MKEPYREGRAGHPGPESCADGRKIGGEALTGAHAGQPLSCEIRLNSGCRRCLTMRKAMSNGAHQASPSRIRRSRRPCACAETSHTGTGRSQERPRGDGPRGPIGEGLNAEHPI